ncbi:D-glycero-beta-D-manno-heptose-7-phosphate kinase [Tanticharoenia sakaeratensis]|uniref:Bifunctional protein HldE n=1 Tax=Tanticharoenia sakaeratensis NBRC 103193 TaxID=1231623 RepID=A0A0D6MHI7_9PROT|nr:D-glycero-beta-D-manno-heptose-7-phosphate kinase [Tanticharoenia sakaeratensis]GAN53109.1 bifunctional protein HldE [Tanticharoenia sakaeratensis NBRC 103193]GBQ20527.1 ADP-heptose synthase [Tanticharoenia sakaeratensis NBRC 103193]
MDFSSITVLCIGDLMLDRFMYGDMERISPEAPVPVLRLRECREMAGGAGNVANNIRALGGRALLLGLVGRDASGTALRARLAATPGIEDCAIVSDARPTTCKTRFIAAHQQVIRTDDESLQLLSDEEDRALRAACVALLDRADVVVVSDYGKGVCSPDVLRMVIEAARDCDIPVFVDPKSRDFGLYRGATCITPNARELGLAAGHATDTLDDVARAAQTLMNASDLRAILATRSEKGMALAERDRPIAAVPTRAREVFDVSGAGDTVIAAMALAYASGMTLEQAMHVANAAAGVVVGKLGTATASRDEVMAELSAQDEALDDAAPTLLDAAGAHSLVARWRAQGLRVGFTNGCFDILHQGHVSLLSQARAACDRLIVALNTDDSVRGLKGPSRPVNPLADRAAVIAALRAVDGVTAFADATPEALIDSLRPDVLVKGADYTEDEVVGARSVRARGGRVVLAKLTPDRSTTTLIARLNSGPS